MAFDPEEFNRTTACEVCQRVGVVGVASSCLGAISFAFCAECLQNRAEPEFMLGMTWDMCNQGKDTADWIQNLTTYVDGNYIIWDEFDTLAKANPERWAFDEEGYAVSQAEWKEKFPDGIDTAPIDFEEFGNITFEETNASR